MEVRKKEEPKTIVYIERGTPFGKVCIIAAIEFILGFAMAWLLRLN